MENGNNGFVLSEELTALREQVKRIIRDEIIPIEDRLDPDAPEIPESEFWPIARRTQAAGQLGRTRVARIACSGCVASR